MISLVDRTPLPVVVDFRVSPVKAEGVVQVLPSDGQARMLAGRVADLLHAELAAREQGIPDGLRLRVSAPSLSTNAVLPRHETVRYRRTQVDLAAAKLLMPEHATYMFDLIEQRTQVRFQVAFELLDASGAVEKRLINGTGWTRWVDCSNRRIVNFFGQHQEVGFTVNDDMERLCYPEGPTGKVASVEDVVARAVAESAAELIGQYR